MIKKLTLIELVDFKYYDETEDENVECRTIVGYFFNDRKIEKVKRLCEERKEEEEEIVITEFDFECAANQKKVYVLYYEYSIYEDEDYTEYEYFFDPMSNKKKCLKLKEKLIKEEKYKYKDYKIFYESNDGFTIISPEIDSLYGISFINEEELNE